MPVEIRELVIKTSVDDSGKNAAKQENAGQSSGTSNADIERIVAICVERVLDLIKQQNER